MIEPTPTFHSQEQGQYQEVFPFTDKELGGLLWRPQRVISMVLTHRRRLAATIIQKHHLPRLVLGLLLTSLLLALPFGAVLGPAQCWRVAILFCGSLLLCFPALHIFSTFFGSRLSLSQNLGLSLLCTCVAAMFSLAFAPILWFLSVTSTPDEVGITGRMMATALLTGSLLAGISHFTRVLHGDRLLRSVGSSSLLFLVLWQGLLVFINYRMALYLELLCVRFTAWARSAADRHPFVSARPPPSAAPPASTRRSTTWLTLPRCPRAIRSRPCAGSIAGYAPDISGHRRSGIGHFVWDC